MSGMIGAGFSALAGFLGYMTGRQRAAEDKLSREAGASEERSAVQQKTIGDIEAARKEKDRADENVRAAPYEERVDKL